MFQKTYKTDQYSLFRNKVAFITGGGSGIGFRITEILMR